MSRANLTEKATLSLGVYITKLLSPITRLPLQREQAKYKRHNTASNQTRQPFFLVKSHPTKKKKKNCTWCREVNFVTGHLGGGRGPGYERLDRPRQTETEENNSLARLWQDQIKVSHSVPQPGGNHRPAAADGTVCSGVGLIDVEL